MLYAVLVIAVVNVALLIRSLWRFVQAARPTYDELVTGPVELSPEALKRIEELRGQPRKPLPAKPLPIRE